MAGRGLLRRGRIDGGQVRLEQQLVGVRVCLAPIEATGGQAAMQRRDRLLEAGGGVQGSEQVHRVQAHHLGRLHQRAVRVLPAAGDAQPVLDEHREQFGPDFAQYPPGRAAAGLVDPAMLLPARCGRRCAAPSPAAPGRWPPLPGPARPALSLSLYMSGSQHSNFGFSVTGKNLLMIHLDKPQEGWIYHPYIITRWIPKIVKILGEAGVLHH